MPHAEIYVVHIYRRTRDAESDLAGVVETVRDGKWHHFGSFEALRSILTADPPANTSSKALVRPRRHRS